MKIFIFINSGGETKPLRSEGYDSKKTLQVLQGPWRFASVVVFIVLLCVGFLSK